MLRPARDIMGKAFSFCLLYFKFYSDGAGGRVRAEDAAPAAVAPLGAALALITKSSARGAGCFRRPGHLTQAERGAHFTDEAGRGVRS